MSDNGLAALSDEQLVHRELSLERDLIAARFRLATNQLDDSSRLKKLRKNIARARGEQRNRELDQGLAKDSLRSRWTSSFDPAAVQSADEGGADGGFLKGIVDKMGANE